MFLTPFRRGAASIAQPVLRQPGQLGAAAGLARGRDRHVGHQAPPREQRRRAAVAVVRLIVSVSYYYVATHLQWLYFYLVVVPLWFCCRYAVAALAEYRPLVLQLGEEDVCVAAVASITRYFSIVFE